MPRVRRFPSEVCPGSLPRWYASRFCWMARVVGSMRGYAVYAVLYVEHRRTLWFNRSSWNNLSDTVTQFLICDLPCCRSLKVIQSLKISLFFWRQSWSADGFSEESIYPCAPHPSRETWRENCLVTWQQRDWIDWKHNFHEVRHDVANQHTFLASLYITKDA